MTHLPSDDQPKVIAEALNDTFIILHCNFALTSLPGLQISRNESPESEDWSPLAMEILSIPGVEQVTLRPYGIGISRAVAFDFPPIIAAAERLLYWVGRAFDPYAQDLLSANETEAVCPHNTVIVD